MIQFFSATDGRVCRRASDEITKQFADKRRYYERNRRADRQTDRQKSIQADRVRRRETYRERETDRERQTEKERQTERLMLIQEPDEWRGVPAVLGDFYGFQYIHSFMKQGFLAQQLHAGTIISGVSY